MINKKKKKKFQFIIFYYKNQLDTLINRFWFLFFVATRIDTTRTKKKKLSLNVNSFVIKFRNCIHYSKFNDLLNHVRILLIKRAVNQIIFSFRILIDRYKNLQKELRHFLFILEIENNLSYLPSVNQYSKWKKYSDQSFALKNGYLLMVVQAETIDYIIKVLFKIKMLWISNIYD